MWCSIMLEHRSPLGSSMLVCNIRKDWCTGFGIPFATI